MTEYDTGRPWLDGLRTVGLDDVGGSGYHVGVMISHSGEECFVLVDGASLGTPAPVWVANWRDLAPHELTGRLPRAYAPKCGRASASGRPCKNVVGQYGQHCSNHQHLTQEAQR